MIKAIVFDCFGVLYVHASEPYFTKHPKHSLALQELRRQADMGVYDRNQYINEVAHVTGDSPELIMKIHQQEYMPNQALIDYIRKELHDHYKIGMLTNVGKGWIQDFFDEHQLHDLFNAVAVSSEIGAIKPDPAAYQAILSMLAVNPDEAVMVDDISENCAGAQRYGMRAVHYQAYHQAIAELNSILASNQFPGK